MLFTVNAADDKLAPLILYCGKNVWDQWMSRKAYEGTYYYAAKSMKDRWDAKVLAWQRLNVGAKMQKHHFSEILGQVWKELAS